MAILPLRGLTQVEGLRNALSPTSSCIKLFYQSLSKFFFGTEGILVAQRGASNQPTVYPNLSVSYIPAPDLLSNQIGVRVWIMIKSYKPDIKKSYSCYMKDLSQHLQDFLKIVKEYSSDKDLKLYFKVQDRSEGRGINLKCTSIYTDWKFLVVFV